MLLLCAIFVLEWISIGWFLSQFYHQSNTSEDWTDPTIFYSQEELKNAGYPHNRIRIEAPKAFCFGIIKSKIKTNPMDFYLPKERRYPLLKKCGLFMSQRHCIYSVRSSSSSLICGAASSEVVSWWITALVFALA